MKIELITIFAFIFLVGLASAGGPGVQITITNNTISGNGLIFYEGFGLYPAPVIIPFNESLNPIFNCTNASDTSSCSFSINYTKVFQINSVENNSLTLSTKDLETKYEACVDEKSKFDAGLTACNTAKVEQGMYKENYTQCYTDLQVCNTQKANSDANVISITKSRDDGANQRWIWGIGGLILGAVIWAIKKGDLGGSKAKQEVESNNPYQSA